MRARAIDSSTATAAFGGLWTHRTLLLRARELTYVTGDKLGSTEPNGAAQHTIAGPQHPEVLPYVSDHAESRSGVW